MLYIIPTPIGNLKDITLRSLEILQTVDLIICEDTRRTSILLNHYQIKKPMQVINDYNERSMLPKILMQLKTGTNIALVSDAGTPLISDPGYKLVRDSIAEGISIDSLPGPSAILPALTLSGLPPDKFFFIGYLPEKPGVRLQMLEKLKVVNQNIKTTFIVYIAPHKLIKTLEDFQKIYGENQELVLAAELTKIYQSVTKLSVKGWLEKFKTKNPRGEYVLLFNLSDLAKHLIE